MRQDSVPYVKFDVTDDRPTVHDEMRGQMRWDPADAAGDEDRVLIVGKLASGTIAYRNLIGMAVQSMDTTIENTATVLDFREGFAITENPDYEMNVALDFPVLAGKLFLYNQVAQSSVSGTNPNTSTVVYNDGATLELNLPNDGSVWTVYGIGGMLLRHSVGTANIACYIQGDYGTARTLTLTTEQMVVDNNSVSGLSYASTGDGIVHGAIMFKSDVAGSATARNPWMVMIGLRTG